MSMITYIGFHFPIEISKDDLVDAYAIDYAHADEASAKAIGDKHFTTTHIYELLQCSYPIWQLTEDYKSNSPHNYEKSKQTFLVLCDSLKALLPKGDFCEVYSCWNGEEEEERMAELTMDLVDSLIDGIEIDEKTYVRIRNLGG